MKFKLYGIIILICFVLGSLLFFNKEGFKSDYSDYKTVDRVINTNNRYGYCIAGEVTCPANTVRKVLNDDYTMSGKGTTYELLCDDMNGIKTNIPVECSGNYVHRLSQNYKMRNQDINVDELNWMTPTARQINFQFSDLYKGFSTPHSYIPVGINEDNIEFYDRNRNILDSLHKCEMLNNQTETNDCYFQLQKYKVTEAARQQAEIAKAAEDAAKAAETAKLEETGGPKKCVANYKTNLGEGLCCGQPGVLQYAASEYVCPESEPVCSNYECGKQYGTCGQ